MIKIGDYVTRKKYNNDIIFKVCEIKDNKVILKGIDIRLIADADINDLILKTKSKKKDDYEIIRKLNIDKNFYIPGRILHIDSDKDYIEKCNKYYKNSNIKNYSFEFKESDYENQILRLISTYNPNIVVITGHDAYDKKNNIYRNSKYFINTVKKIRKIYKSNSDIIIIAGACQSDFDNLIKSGATYASSPKHINIHALDPAIIATYIALTDITNIVDLEEVLNKTKFGPDGIGGIKTMGKMMVGYPRKE